jgi:membrane protease YdiL (CAAX protease family)
MNVVTNPSGMNGASPTGDTRFGKTFLALFGLGLLGVLTLIPMIMSQLDALPPELAALPTPVVALLSLLNPIILLAIAVAVGTLLAHRVGLRSLTAEKVRLGTAPSTGSGHAVWPNLRPHVPLAFVAGLVFAFVVVGLDQLMDPFANAEIIGEMPNEGNPFMQLLLGLLYGGITEELLLRWGFMSLLVWLGWRVLQRGEGAPRPAIMWTAIILAAILFGVGHLPALAGIVVLTPLLIFRTILLNALGGLLFGWLFWRRNLETAMVAHAAGHVGFFIVNMAVLVIGG